MSRIDGVVALLTDFGLSDSYVGVMKAVILSSCPGISFIDLTHDVPPQNIISASLLLASAWSYLPEKTVCLAVVDPGVGSERREVVIDAGNRYLVSPDNGTATLLIEEYPEARSYRIDERRYRRLVSNPGSSTTFHGRDLFSPIAADIVRYGFDAVSAEPVDPVMIGGLTPRPAHPPRESTPGSSKESSARWIEVPVLHVDHFGNCVTGLRRAESDGKISEVRVPGGTKRAFAVEGISTYYAAVGRGAPLAYWGSAGYLELAVREGNAAESFGISQLERVLVRFV